MDDIQKQKIQELVHSAISNAKSWSDIEPVKTREKELVQQFLTGNITLDKFNQEINKLDSNIFTLHFYSLSGFTFALECFGATEEQIDGIVKEQMPRYSSGVSSNISTRFSITPYKKSDGQLVLIPGIQGRIDRLMKEETFRAALGRLQSV